MAVHINKITVAQVVKALGISPVILDALSKADISITLGKVSLSFVNYTKAWADKGKSPMLGKLYLSTPLSAYVHGSVSASEVLQSKTLVEKKALDALKNSGVALPVQAPSSEGVSPPDDFVSVDTYLKSVASSGKAAPVNPVSAAATADVPKEAPPAVATKSAPVLLRDAVSLYQPVKGSSTGSVYYVVALGERVKLAARVKGTTLSVRAEGNMKPSDDQALKSVGLSEKGEYWSVHFDCVNNVTPERVLGSVIIGSGLEFLTPLPSVSKLKELCK